MTDKEKEIESLIELIKDERIFLHDISNYAVVLQGVASYLNRIDISDPSTIDTEKFTKRAEGLSVAVKKLILDIKARRSKLKEVSSD
ncbi:hypothetical protein OAT67_00195 [Bacteriovoracaceae bacterium]|nr:hypothetical protein [Bacteriovoracaceae bacterium]